MRRFGYSLVLLYVVLAVAGSGGCDERAYDEKDMGRLATFTRVVMDIVKSTYIEAKISLEIPEDKIRKIVIENNTDFEEIALLDLYDMKIVSDGEQIESVIWDPASNRKLIEDLRCTKKLDWAAWRTVTYGSDFTLNWSLCQ